MRTTVTLDPDTRLLVERAMRERGIGFNEAVNEAIRAGLAGPGGRVESPTVAAPLGRPQIDLTKALELAAALEDEELARRMGQGR